MAWTWAGRLDPWQCLSCGRPQEEYQDRKDIEAVLCGRCAMILADASEPCEDPLSPEERATMDQRKRLAAARERRQG